jgi:hypothetical protein
MELRKSYMKKWSTLTVFFTLLGIGTQGVCQGETDPQDEASSIYIYYIEPLGVNKENHSEPFQRGKKSIRRSFHRGKSRLSRRGKRKAKLTKEDVASPVLQENSSPKMDSTLPPQSKSFKESDASCVIENKDAPMIHIHTIYIRSKNRLLIEWNFSSLPTYSYEDGDDTRKKLLECSEQNLFTVHKLELKNVTFTEKDNQEECNVTWKECDKDD